MTNSTETGNIHGSKVNSKVTYTKANGKTAKCKDTESTNAKTVTTIGVIGNREWNTVLVDISKAQQLQSNKAIGKTMNSKDETILRVIYIEFLINE